MVARLTSRLLALACVSFMASSLQAQGTWLSSAGPVNRSMGGASVAAPIDSMGAIYWNPASISGMKKSETAFGLDVLWSQQTIESSVGPFAGATKSDNGTFPIPNVGWVYKTEEPALTLGLGVNGVGGFKTNLPSDPNNPALAPAPFGLGQVSSQAQFMQIAPVIAYAISEELSVAVGPTITTGEVQLDPFVLGSVNADGNYANGRSAKNAWGAGVQAGVYYIANDEWRFGSSLKSTSWMADFQFFGEDANGLPRSMSADIDLPLIFSIGTSYAGFEDVLIALDIRYFDYGNTAGFGDRAIFDATGKLGGLDWSSIMAVALGCQKKFSDTLTGRVGYTYNQNPVKNSEAFYNIASPLIYEHMVSMGGSLTPNEKVSFNVGYSYLIENTRSGQIVQPGFGAIPGSTFLNSLDGHFLSFGIAMSH